MLLSLSISLMVLFIHATTWDGHINSWIKDYINPDLKISKPIYGCPICMSFWYGSIYYFLTVSDISFIGWFSTVFTAGGFSVLWVLAIDIKDSLTEKSK